MHMRKGIPDYFELQNYNISPNDIVRLTLHCETSDIRSRVIVSPVWKENIFFDHVDSVETIAEGFVYEIVYGDRKFTYIRSGIGAPQTGDVILALGCTPCKNIIFIGTVGGLSKDLVIGDLVLVTESISGDGFSNYLRNKELAPTNFLKSAKPNSELNSLLEKQVRFQCQNKDVILNKGVVFSSDSIIAQFPHLDSIVKKFNCIGVEMETSAVFNAAALVGIKASAILQVSDVIPVYKSLFSGRTKKDHQRRRDIRKKCLSKIVLDTFCDNRID